MKLTREEKEMLDGKGGHAIQKAMELLVAVGECYDAEQMVPVASAHLPSANPVSAGKGGTIFIKEMAKTGKFVVPTTTNPACLEPWSWREMGFSEELYQEFIALSEAIAQMGGVLCNTCTPYVIGHTPRMKEHVAWGESSAVVYANAVVGSRTNREGGPSALAAALTGRTPAYGYHLDENRYGNTKIIVNVNLKGTTQYAILGFFAGKITQDRTPVFTGIPLSVSQHELKYLGAACATSGSISHYHIVGVTPEAPTEEAAFGRKKISSSDIFEFGPKEFQETKESLCKVSPDKAELVVLGCPHVSIDQVRHYSEILSGRRVKNHVEIWILIPHIIKQYAEDIGCAKTIESSGAKLVSNTCPSAMPRDFFKKRGYKVIATDSPKMVYYASTTKDALCYCDSLDNLIDVVTHTI